jgi:hypothetical protein
MAEMDKLAGRLRNVANSQANPNMMAVDKIQMVSCKFFFLDEVSLGGSLLISVKQ